MTEERCFIMPESELQKKDSIILSFDSVQAWYDPKKLIIKSGQMTVPSNSVVGLVGANGTGKTTLVNSLCGIHQQSSFEGLTINGNLSSPQDMNFKLSRYACFAQDRSFRYWNLIKLIRFIEKAFYLEKEEDYLYQLIDGFGLAEVSQKRLGDLSDGQRKKVALCSAFYARRSLLLLDEPVDFLDFSSTEFLYDTIRSYASRYGSIVLCSHIAESITRCCTSLYSLKDGIIAGPFEVPKNSEDVSNVLAG